MVDFCLFVNVVLISVCFCLSHSSFLAMPVLKPASTWTSESLKELKTNLQKEKGAVVKVYRGNIMTVHVPTVAEYQRVCWEFATDSYDIGFGVYFDWSPITNCNITVHISESSDDEDEEEEQEGQRKFILHYIILLCLIKYGLGRGP